MIRPGSRAGIGAIRSGGAFIGTAAHAENAQWLLEKFRKTGLSDAPEQSFDLCLRENHHRRERRRPRGSAASTNKRGDPIAAVGRFPRPLLVLGWQATCPPTAGCRQDTRLNKRHR